jgi:RHS repeat-associated protein
MAMKRRFYTVDGQMLAYEESGVRKDFLTDHLGSITAEIDQTQTRTYDTRYSAYGRNNWSTGTGCGFGWVGSYGYRETGLFHMSHYVRARHYSYLTGSWSTVDPLWPDESAYGYVGGRAVFGSDPNGKGPIKDAVEAVCASALKLLNGKDSSDLWDRINSCMSEGGEGCKPINLKTVNCLVSIACGGGGSSPGPEIVFDPKECCIANKKGGHADDCAWVEVNPKPGGGSSFGKCLSGASGRPRINVCKATLGPLCDPFNTPRAPEITIMHEILHCCGVPHGSQPPPNTCNNRMACCIQRETGRIPKGTKCYR